MGSVTIWMPSERHMQQILSHSQTSSVFFEASRRSLYCLILLLRRMSTHKRSSLDQSVTNPVSLHCSTNSDPGLPLQLLSQLSVQCQRWKWSDIGAVYAGGSKVLQGYAAPAGSSVEAAAAEGWLRGKTTPPAGEPPRDRIGARRSAAWGLHLWGGLGSRPGSPLCWRKCHCCLGVGPCPSFTASSMGAALKANPSLWPLRSAGLPGSVVATHLVAPSTPAQELCCLLHSTAACGGAVRHGLLPPIQSSCQK